MIFAASRSGASIRAICPQLPKGTAWPENVEFVGEGPGITTDHKEVSYCDLLHNHYARAASSLAILNDDPAQCTSVGFTSLIETMAMARPVIFTRTGAVPSEIDVEKVGCGIHVPPQDPEALAQAIRHLASDPQRAEEMGKAGRRLAESHYNIRRYAARLHEFFSSL